MALLLRRRGQAQAVVFYGLGSCVFPLASEQASENCSFKSMGFWLCLRLVVFVLYLVVSREAYAGCLQRTSGLAVCLVGRVLWVLVVLWVRSVRSDCLVAKFGCG